VEGVVGTSVEGGWVERWIGYLPLLDWIAILDAIAAGLEGQLQMEGGWACRTGRSGGGIGGEIRCVQPTPASALIGLVNWIEIGVCMGLGFAQGNIDRCEGTCDTEPWLSILYFILGG
jgi:hypothetical protein